MEAVRRRVRNRVTELQTSKLLDALGFVGRSAIFERMELVALEPPGWVQIFTFDVRIDDAHGDRRTVFGALCDDERFKPRLHVTHDPQERDRVLADWSDGMVTVQAGARATRGSNAWLFVALGLLLLALATLVGVASGAVP